ncbi:MAG: nuclear transport factor 2 family protein [bacterium]|nr:nuclear transport factor 2 family protein [bacterium]
MKRILNLATLLALATVLVTSGCTTTAGGPSDDAQIAALLDQWKQAVLQADADKLMTTYSANFAHDGYDYDAEDKAALKAYIDGAISEGAFADVDVSVEDADVEIEEGVATVYPIDYTIAEGSIMIELTLTKESAGWLITDMLLEGM